VQARAAKTILICEDDDNLRQLIRVVIGPGYRIVEAGDGDEALALAGEHRPDLIVLDLMMPRMSGFDVLRRLRGDVSVDGTPIVVMSAWPKAQEAALEAGADRYLQKPFEPDDLTKIVESLLSEQEE
jgi:DNA-binding response OmpR family regulator